MPTKSTGCATCRKRKIRCDEGRPGCNRCKTHNVPCPGYRLPAKGQLFFQDDTSSTVLAAHKSYKTQAPATYTSPGGSHSPSSIDAPTNGTNYSLILSRSSSSPKTDEIYNNIPQESAFEFAHSMALYATPTYLPSPLLEKQLIYSTFLDTYLPKARLPSDTNFGFLSHLLSTSNLRPEVNDALDALSLAQVGSTYNDKALLREAVRSYSRSLGGLVKAMGKGGGGGGVKDDFLLATVTLLANCEFYDEISQMGDGWAKHIAGQQQLLRARGPNSIQSRLSLLIYSNSRHAALSHALIARKACFMGSEEWRSVAWRAPNVDSATLIYDSALQVPAVLEKADKLDSDSKTFVADLDHVLAEARKLRMELQSWYDGYEKRSKYRKPGDDALFWLTKINNFPTFTDVCADRALDEGYMFPTFMVGYLLSVYWNTMYFLQTTVQKLHIKRHEASPKWMPAEGEVVTEDELTGYIMNLCRCFPFFCEPISSCTGKIATFLPMWTAVNHFIEHGHWRMLKWCGNVKDSIFNGGLQPPRMRPGSPVAVMLSRG